jgi:hypothetical protein
LDDEDVLSDKELIIKQVSRCIVLMDVCWLYGFCLLIGRWICP